MSNLEANRLELRSDLAELKRLAGWLKAQAQQESRPTPRSQFNFALRKLSPTSLCTAAAQRTTA